MTYSSLETDLEYRLKPYYRQKVQTGTDDTGEGVPVTGTRYTTHCNAARDVQT